MRRQKLREWSRAATDDYTIYSADCLDLSFVPWNFYKKFNNHKDDVRVLVFSNQHVKTEAVTFINT